MIKLLLLIFITTLFSGCINKRGISTKYYNRCNEYYDYQGMYHKVCDDNEILEKKTLTDIPKKVDEFINDDASQENKNVW